MKRLHAASVLVGLTLVVSGASAAPAAQRAGPLATRHVQTLDTQRRIDINQLNMWVTNFGSIAFDIDRGNSGLEYPKGSGRLALFAAGLWLGGTVGGGTRATVAEYSFEYGPGSMVGGAAADAARPEYRVYKVARWTGQPPDSAHLERTAAEQAADPLRDPLAHDSWSEYMAGAAAHGAPWRLYRLPNTATPSPSDSVDIPGPDVRGDQMLWCVYNDADPARHTSAAGGTAPLGVEVRQTTFAYDRPGPLGSTVFIRYELFNFGTNTITQMHTSLWSDPDVGGAGDDLIGCMESRSLGYAYNSTDADIVYGAAVPAVGFDLLSEHFSPVLGRNTGMDAFTKYVGGTDPASAVESYNHMRGLQPDGTQIIDPTTGQPTTFMVSGDPVTGSGWIDAFPSNRLMVCSSGPWTLAPGDSLTLWVALVVGQDDASLSSVTALGCADDYVQSIFDSGFAEPFAAPPVCALPPSDCPRTAAWWADQCAGAGALSPAELLAIAQWADSTSSVFSFSDPAQYCGLLDAPTATARDSAVREYLALLSNVAAGELGLTDGVMPIGLAPSTYVSIPPLLNESGGSDIPVRQVIQDKPDSIRLTNVSYENTVLDHRRALTGVDWGGGFFFKGADYGWNLWGGTLDPSAVPADSFPNVEIRFSATATSMAYRYLRLEEVGTGNAPNGNREYRYGGFVPVNFQVWDTDHDVQLDAAFVERAVTDANGTILDAAQQVATFDSTWAPDASTTGGREYLFLLKTPYSDTPKAPYEVDNAMNVTPMPILYALWARLRAQNDVIDDGDAMRFAHGYPPTPSAERLFLWLAALPQSDTSAIRQSHQFAAGAADVNQGLGIGLVCLDAAIAPATLLEASADGSQVTLRWSLGVTTSSARLEYRNPFGVWLEAGAASIQGNIVTAIHDYGGSPASRIAYRLALAAPVGLARTDSVWVTLPTSTLSLALANPRPNPSRDGRAFVEFMLPQPGTVRLEVYDIGGRRVTGRDVTGMSAGTHYMELAPGVKLDAGVYFVRLKFGAEVHIGRLVVLR